MSRARALLYSAKGVGIVVLSPSGVIFSNQAGGYACLQPELEGVYVPLDDDFNDIETKLSDYFTGPKHLGTGATRGHDEDDADRIDEILHSRSVPCPVAVDRQRLGESVEAWVFVRLRADDGPFPILEGFQTGSPAVLTWTNSD
jgi:hypothetical protein